MKNILFLLPLCLPVFLMSCSSENEVVQPIFIGENASGPKDHIAVRATISERVIPDVIIWKLAISDLNMDPVLAKQSSDKKAEKVINLKDTLSIDDENIQICQVSMEQEFEHFRDAPKVFKGYRIKRSVTIRQTDMNKFDQFLEELSKIGLKSINYSYDLADKRAVRERVRMRVIEELNRKARVAATGLGASVGKPIQIGDTTPSSMVHNYRVTTRHDRPTPDLVTGSFAPSAIEISMSLAATFKLEEPTSD